MAENSTIEWTHHTFNPWWGCQKVSPACDNCYAERDANRFAPGRVLWGVDAERRTFGDKHWNEPLRWNEHARRNGVPARVFCASMADVFDKNAPEGARERLWHLILQTPHLEWLLLTKRIGNARSMLPREWQRMRVFGELDNWPANLRIGSTFCNQEEVNRDMRKLLSLFCPNFVSLEPLLGAINLTRVESTPADSDWTYIDNALTGFHAHKNGGFNGKGIDWVIAGGESGPKARPAHPDWFRSLRDQCAAAGVPFLFKQWGEWREPADGEPFDTSMGRAQRVPAFIVAPGGTVHCFENDQTREGGKAVIRLGKKAAGRLLDGVEHNGFPGSAS